MNFEHHPSNNMILGAPKGTEDWVSKLPATMMVQDDGTVIASFWKPTPEELAQLNAGQHVVLYVYGTSHPVVAIGVAP